MRHLAMASRVWVLALLAAAACASQAAAAAGVDTIIVKVKSAGEQGGFSIQSAEGGSSGSGSTAQLGEPIGQNLRRVTLQPGVDLQAHLDELSRIEGVEYAVPDSLIKHNDPIILPQLVPDNVEYFSKQWGAVRVGLPSAWNIATGAASPETAVTVCVVDSGVDYKHPDLVDNLDPEVGFNAINGKSKSLPWDDAGHGTAVAGVIGASGRAGGVVGANWDNINLLSCKFMTGAGWGKTSDAIQCMDYCLDKGAHIISASWTCGEEGNRALKEAVERAQEQDVLLVVAAGNQGKNMGRTPYYPQAYALDYDNVLVVGASTEYDEHAPFSNYDDQMVHLSAPGNWIWTTATRKSYNYSSGTSIAAPFVTGSAALLKAVAKDRLNLTLSAVDLKQRLMDSVEELPGLKHRSVTGGRLRIDWALQKLLGKKLSPPMPTFRRKVPGKVKASSLSMEPIQAEGAPDGKKDGEKGDNGDGGAPAEQEQAPAKSPAAAAREEAAGAPAVKTDKEWFHNTAQGVCGQLEQEVAFGGGAIDKQRLSKSVGSCFALCAKEPECRALTYYPKLRECHLKLGIGWSRQPTHGAQSVVLVPCVTASQRSIGSSSSSGSTGSTGSNVVVVGGRSNPAAVAAAEFAGMAAPAGGASPNPAAAAVALNEEGDAAAGAVGEEAAAAAQAGGSTRRLLSSRRAAMFSPF